MTESAVVTEILEQALLSEMREVLLEAIRFRFPEVLTEDVERAISDQPSLDLMRRWRRSVFSAASAEAFLQVLRQ